MAPSGDDEIRRLREELEQLAARHLELESRVRDLESGLRSTPRAGIHRTPRPQASAAPATPHPARPAFETRFGLTLINRIGVITLVVGAGFFFRYAIENQWIGMGARVALGMVAGLAAIWTADRLHRRGQRPFAQGITGLGVALVYVSVWAADDYHLLPAAAAFALMLLITAGAGLLALRYRSLAVALLGLSGGYVTPLVIRPPDLALSAYIAILASAAVWLARRQNWRALEMFALFWTAILYFSTIQGGPKSRALATAFLVIYLAAFTMARSAAVASGAYALGMLAIVVIWGQDSRAYLLMTLALSAAALAIAALREVRPLPVVALGAYWLAFAIWHPRPAMPSFVAISLLFLFYFAWTWLREPSPLVVALNGIAYYAGSYALLAPQHRRWVGLYGIALAGAHYALARVLRRSREDASALALAVATALFTVAIPLEVGGFRITIAWAAEAAVLAWFGAQWKERRATIAAWIVLFLAFLRLMLADALMYPAAESYAAVLNARFLSFVAVALSCWAVAKWTVTRKAALTAYIAGHIILLFGAVAEVFGWAARTASPDDRGSLAAASLSILLAAYAVALIAFGAVKASALDRALGLILIGIVVVKLYAYDIWLLRTLYRTTAFVVLGILLVASSYLYSRYRERIEHWWRERSSSAR
jgi:uncharacterized membrane protein